jgi:hypothetical protein
MLKNHNSEASSTASIMISSAILSISSLSFDIATHEAKQVSEDTKSNKDIKFIAVIH